MDEAVRPLLGRAWLWHGRVDTGKYRRVDEETGQRRDKIPVHTDQRHPAIRRLPDRARHRKLFPAFGHTVPKSRDPSSDRCRNQGTVWQDRCVQPQKRSRGTRRIANEYPVLFRLIYLNGMRPGEACRIQMENVDLVEGTVLIQGGKGNKDRLIHLSGDMAELCRDYRSYLRETLGHEPEWLFPGIKPENPLSYGSVSAMFRRCWLETAFAGHCDRNPTAHCLRHAYVVKRIDLWRRQGLDFEHMLPYLSKFLGHKSFDESYYYYHLAEESVRTIREKDTVIGRVIPEVMRR